MASSSKAHDRFREETDDEEEEVEGFDDFTIASSWERFISEIEAVCRLWLIDGPENLMEKGADSLGASSNLYKVKSELQYNTKSYCLEYYFEINTDGKVMEWNDGLHILQLSFGVKNFLVIAPISVSGVVLDAPEASKLLSATAIALSNCCSTWPAFVPVHDPSRKAYMGIQNLGTIFTRRFEADRIGSQVPIKLMHLEGLYELFVSKFALSAVEFSMSFFNVHFTMKLTYRTPSDDDANDIQGATESSESDGKLDGLTRSQAQWDDDCPWAEWYSVEDPIKGFELITIWSSKMVESSLEMAELENVSALEADKWLLFPLLSTNMTDDSKGNTIGFTSQLCLLVNVFHTSFEAQFIEDFVSAEKVGADTLRSSTIVPPPTVLDRVLKDLFHEGDQISNYGKEEHINSHFIKGAPLPSLFAQFCLHSLWFGNCNIRAISVLWIEFVREVRWCWEESQPLPRMLNNGSIDLSTCLIHQKLQMLSICIAKKSQLDEFHDCDESKSPAINGTEEGYYDADEYQNQNPLHQKRHDQMHDSTLLSDDQISKKHMGVSPSKSENVFASPNMAESSRGSAGIVQSTMLLRSPQKMHAPYTQDAPLMTEDMHEERLRAAETFGDAFSFSGQLEKDILSSDMSAFKAANPGAVFEDFIRWHSPGDWESEETSKNGSFIDDEFGAQNTKWPPSGRLSQRMSEQGNSWRKIWNDSPALAVFEQKPLLDPNKEGEKILHYLETLKPHQLIEQMVCTAFRASADTLSLTSFGNLKQLRTKIGQLYLTIASTLKPLGVNHLHDDELIDDLKRLCLVFEHIEKLVTHAASMHRRLLNVPRLCEAIFSDYFNFYIPKMGTSSTSICYEKEFNIREPVRTQERPSIESMFTPPTANQSWRKVLSMGNLLNGHEPTLREIVLSVHDSMSGNHYGTGNTQSTSDEIETYRMYIRGTSNDLQVALSVTSCD